MWTSKKTSRWITKDKWEIHSGEFSPDGKRLTFSANVDGNEDIYLHDLATGKSTALAIPKGVNEPAGGHSAFSADGLTDALLSQRADCSRAIFGSITSRPGNRNRLRIRWWQGFNRKIWLSRI